MHSRFQIISLLAAAILLSGCGRPSADLQEMSRDFRQRHPEYVLRSISAGKAEGNRKTVAIEFDAPNNFKSRGRASVVFDKQADGSWKCVQEEISMWTK